MKRFSPIALAAISLTLALLVATGCSPKKKDPDQPPALGLDTVNPDSLASLMPAGKAGYARVDKKGEAPVILDLRQGHSALNNLFGDVKSTSVKFSDQLEADWQKGKHVVLTELSPADAGRSFIENIDLDLDIADRAGAALVRRSSGEPGVEIAYSFPGLGKRAEMEKIRRGLLVKWEGGEDSSLWMPWGAFVDLRSGNRGPFMGSFDAGNFQLALWIDQFGNDLFVCYRQKPAASDPGPGG